MLIQLTDVRYYVHYSDRKRTAKKIPNSMSFSQLAKLVKMGVEFYNGNGKKSNPLRDNLKAIVFGYKVTHQGRTYYGTSSFVPDVYDDSTPILNQFDSWFRDLRRDCQMEVHDDAMVEENENNYRREFGNKQKGKK